MTHTFVLWWLMSWVEIGLIDTFWHLSVSNSPLKTLICCTASQMYSVCNCAFPLLLRQAAAAESYVSSVDFVMIQ